MKLLVVTSGANTAIKDLDRGYVDAFRALGATVIHYDLERRVTASTFYLRQLWDAYDRKPAEPTLADILYDASFRVLERALRHETDLVLIIGGLFFHPDALELLRRAGQRVALLLTESPYDDAEQSAILPMAELAFTTERTSLYYLGQFCRKVLYLPHAYDPARHFPAQDEDGEADSGVDAHDVVFVGTGFEERVEILRAVRWGQAGISFGLYGSLWEEEDYWLRLHLRAKEIENNRAAALYRHAKIGLNLYRSRKWHRDAPAPQIVYAESLNPRAVELAACGVFTVSEYRAEVAEVFGEWVPTFRQPADLEPLLVRCLADPDFRREAAQALPALVAGRTFVDNARRILAEFAAVVGTAPQPALASVGNENGRGRT